MRVIGLDVGEKRIGVARADSSTRIAVPLGFIEANGSEWQEIARIASVNSTNLFVLGLPRSNEGNETAQSAYVRDFARKLVSAIPDAKVKFQDESLTSVIAEERLKSRGKAYEKGEIDAEAATIILQDFIESAVGSFADQKTQPSPDTTACIDNPISDIGAESVVWEGEENGKKKSKKSLKVLSVVIIVVILGLLVAGVLLWIREQRRAERAEEYARQEAAMQAEVFNFTILPGETIYDIKDSLVEAGYSISEVEEAFNADYDFDFLKDRPEGATLEGYLFGETHEFYEGTSVKEILTEYLKGMGKVIQDNNLEGRFKEHGLTLYEGITLASVVQKEAATSDQPTVAQVFLSRLSYGMLLGSDVTVSYALDTVDPNRQIYADNSAALTIDSCYNTRLHPGLPCGPISNPGLSALLAVAEPSDTSYLYFLTGDDGMMYYSYTEAEHNQNIYSHCQDLCNTSL